MESNELKLNENLDLINKDIMISQGAEAVRKKINILESIFINFSW